MQKTYREIDKGWRRVGQEEVFVVSLDGENLSRQPTNNMNDIVVSKAILPSSGTDQNRVGRKVGVEDSQKGHEQRKKDQSNTQSQESLTGPESISVYSKGTVRTRKEDKKLIDQDIGRPEPTFTMKHSL